MSDNSTTAQRAQNGLTSSAAESLKTLVNDEFMCPICLDAPLTHQAQEEEDTRSDESESDSDSSHGSDEGSDDDEFGWQQNQGDSFVHHNYYAGEDDERVEGTHEDLETHEQQHNTNDDNDDHEMIHQFANESDDLQYDEEEQLNAAHIDSRIDTDDLVQPTNDGTSNGIAVMPPATAIPTSAVAMVAEGKKRSRVREAASSNGRRSPRNAMTRTSSKKRAKLPHSTSTVHDTSEEVGTSTAQPRVLRRSTRRTTNKACEGTFEGTRRGIEAEEESDDDFMPVDEEDGPPDDDGDYDHDGPPDDDGDYDHDEDGYKSIVAECTQHGRSSNKSFDERFTALMGYKHKFGHCNVPQKKSGDYLSLGNWCSNLRSAYKKIQKSETPAMNLTPENIRQLEDAGFRWSRTTSFDKGYAELMEYKEKNGHCNVSETKSSVYKSLGKWCSNLRSAYKKIQKRETPNHKLTPENIQQLDDAGFKWRLTTSFDEGYAELMSYKEKNGHCNVPRKKSGEYQSLGQWCSNLRTSYKKIQKRQTSYHKLTEEHIKQLDDAGFKWRAT